MSLYTHTTEINRNVFCFIGWEGRKKCNNQSFLQCVGCVPAARLMTVYGTAAHECVDQDICASKMPLRVSAYLMNFTEH